MNYGLLLSGCITIILCAIPLFLVFLDYHKKENIHKAILYIVSFIALLFIFSFILIPLFSFYIMLVIPVLLMIYLLIARR
jgi:hypothetical protein